MRISDSGNEAKKNESIPIPWNPIVGSRKRDETISCHWRFQEPQKQQIHVQRPPKKTRNETNKSKEPKEPGSPNDPFFALPSVQGGRARTTYKWGYDPYS